MRKWMKYSVLTGLAALLSTTFVACVAPAPTIEPPPAPTRLTTTITKKEGKMVHQIIQLTNKQADGYIIPLGTVNIVCVITDVGMVGCGAFDVIALDAFDYPAVRVKSAIGNPIATIDDLLAGVVKDANTVATKLGINVGMSGREVLDLL